MLTKSHLRFSDWPWLDKVKGSFNKSVRCWRKPKSSAVDKYLRRWNSLRNPALPTWGRSSARSTREDQVEREWKGWWETFWGFARSLLCKVIYVWSIWKSWQLDWQTCLVQKLEVMPICQFFIGRLNDLIKDIGLMKLVMQVREGVQIFFWGGDFSQMWVGGMHSGLKWGSGGG